MAQLDYMKFIPLLQFQPSRPLIVATSAVVRSTWHTAGTTRPVIELVRDEAS